MAQLNIPAANRDGVSKLLSIPSAVFDQFLAEVSAQPPGVKLIAHLRSAIKISNLSSVDCDKMVTAVIGFHVVKASRDDTLDEFTADLIRAVETFDKAGSSEESKRRLRSVLEIRTLAVSAKAFTIYLDQERPLYAAKILTDIRYAFQSDPNAAPYGAVILHTLKLSYHHEGSHHDVLVGLDGDDLSNLKATIERAEAKAEKLRKDLATLGLADLTNEEPRGGSKLHKG